jgi:hypothetical protein
MQHAHEWIARKDRHVVDIDAVVHRMDGRKVPAKLSNLSDEGCRIDAPNDFRIGERLHIAIPRMGHVRAQVRWILPDSAGAKFLVESDF